MTTNATVRPKIRPAKTDAAPAATKTAVKPLPIKGLKRAAPPAETPAETTRSAEKGARTAVSAAPAPDISFGYDGASGLVNRNKSRTVVRHAEFNTLPHAKRSVRDDEFLKGLRAKFDNKTFTRSRLDAGALNRAIARGLIQPISGEGVSESDTYRLTKSAFPAQA